MNAYTKGLTLGAAATMLIMLPISVLGQLYFFDRVPQPYPLEANDPDPKITFSDTVLDNGCYVAASGYKDAYDAQMQLAKRQHWSKLMYVDVVSTTGHAICIFHYNGRWHAYDNLKGTQDLGTFDRDPSPNDIATKISKNYKNAEWMK